MLIWRTVSFSVNVLSLFRSVHLESPRNTRLLATRPDAILELSQRLSTLPIKQDSNGSFVYNSPGTNEPRCNLENLPYVPEDHIEKTQELLSAYAECAAECTSGVPSATMRGRTGEFAFSVMLMRAIDRARIAGNASRARRSAGKRKKSGSAPTLEAVLAELVGPEAALALEECDVLTPMHRKALDAVVSATRVNSLERPVSFEDAALFFNAGRAIDTWPSEQGIDFVVWLGLGDKPTDEHKFSALTVEVKNRKTMQNCEFADALYNLISCTSQMLPNDAPFVALAVQLGPLVCPDCMSSCKSKSFSGEMSVSSSVDSTIPGKVANVQKMPPSFQKLFGKQSKTVKRSAFSVPPSSPLAACANIPLGLNRRDRMRMIRWNCGVHRHLPPCFTKNISQHGHGDFTAPLVDLETNVAMSAKEKRKQRKIRADLTLDANDANSKPRLKAKSQWKKKSLKEMMQEDSDTSMELSNGSEFLALEPRARSGKTSKQQSCKDSLDSKVNMRHIKGVAVGVGKKTRKQSAKAIRIDRDSKDSVSADNVAQEALGTVERFGSTAAYPVCITQGRGVGIYAPDNRSLLVTLEDPLGKDTILHLFSAEERAILHAICNQHFE